jgi:uncharacterized membrane protein
MASPIPRLAPSTGSWAPLIAARSQPDRRQVAVCDQVAIETDHPDRLAGPIEEEAIMRVEESIIIDRSPEEVFRFISVRTNDPAWMASVTESEWLDPDAPMAVGRRGRMVMQAMGRREFLDEVTEYEPGRRIAHRSVAGPMQIRTACTASQQAPAGARPSCTSPNAFPAGSWAG